MNALHSVLQSLKEKHKAFIGVRNDQITSARADGFKSGLLWAIDTIETAIEQEQIETLYRKIAVSERLPNEGNTVFILNEKDEWQANGYFDRGEWFNDFDNECPCFPTHWLEEIPDNSHQIQTLEAEKAELLEALEKVHELVTDFTADYLISLLMIEDVSEKAIQKHQK